MTTSNRAAAPEVQHVSVPPAPPNAWPPRTEEPRPYHDGDPTMRMRRADPALKTPAARRTAISLGRQLHALRQERGLTQEQAARLVGWDQPQWARLEAGRVYPTLATLDLLASRLGVRIVLTPHATGLAIALEALSAAA
ncbi:MAG: helix-turn-helix transcriptional regulator [Chloroflexi bacterium]|nr:helix-turn-helix transcriptional regulator [Chloroflexota bacterium]